MKKKVKGGGKRERQGGMGVDYREMPDSVSQSRKKTKNAPGLWEAARRLHEKIESAGKRLFPS